MDLSADSIADPGRLIEDVENMQSNVSEENKLIWKMEIEHDCAFWRLKERQEEISSKYQAYLRTRPEFISNVEHTNMLVEEMEKAMQQCVEQAAKDKKNRETLMEMYATADGKLRSLKQQYVTDKEQGKNLTAELQLKLKEKNEQNEQLSEKYHNSQIQIQKLESMLEEARSDRNVLSASAEDVKTKLDLVFKELHKRDGVISNQQREMRIQTANYLSQLAESKNILIKKDNDLKSAAEEIESLKKALSDQRVYTKIICNCNDDMALVEEQHQEAETSNNSNKKKLEEMTSMCENFKNNMLKLKDENEALSREMDSKQQLLNAYTEEIESDKQRFLDYDIKLDKVTLELNKTTEESEKKNKLIEELKTEVETVVKTLSETQDGFKNYREEAEEKLKSLAQTIEEKCHEIEIHGTATKELQSEKEERAKLVVELQNTTASLEDKSSQVSQLEAAMRAKDEEHSRELADVIKRRNELEMEKNVLEDVIKGLEQRIINREVAFQTQAERSNFQPALDKNTVDEWVQSTCREANRRQVVETDENAMMILPHRNSLQDNVFNFFSSSENSFRAQYKLPPRAKMSKQARQEIPATSRATGRKAAAAAAQTHVAPPAKQARHDDPTTSRADDRNDAAAADAGTADSTAKPRRFFKTPRNRSRINY